MFSSFERESLNPFGSFHERNQLRLLFRYRYTPSKYAGRQMHVITKMIHCFAIIHLMSYLNGG